MKLLTMELFENSSKIQIMHATPKNGKIEQQINKKKTQVWLASHQNLNK